MLEITYAIRVLHIFETLVLLLLERYKSPFSTKHNQNKKKEQEEVATNFENAFQKTRYHTWSPIKKCGPIRLGKHEFSRITFIQVCY